MNAGSSKFNTNGLREELLEIIPQSVMERVLLIMGDKAPPKPFREKVFPFLGIGVRRSKYTKQLAKCLVEGIIDKGSIMP